MPYLIGGFKFGSQNSTVKLTTANSLLKLNSPVDSFNGTLKIESNSAASVQSNNSSCSIVFNQGVFSSGASSYILTGTYDGTNTDSTILGSGDTLEVAAGQVLQTVVAKGTVGNPSIIRGQPIFSYSPTIFDSNSCLAIAIENQLNQSVVLNGGTLKLLDNLSICLGSFFSGTGTIDCNNFRIDLPENTSTPWSNSLTFKNVVGINLNGNAKLSGTWYFSDASGKSFLNGNGNILDLSGGGILQVASNHTLYITDVQIKGIGTGLGRFALNVVNGTVKLSNVTLELGANYSHSSGQIYISGEGCKLISGNTTFGNYTFDVSSTGTLTVDHQTFNYDNLASADAFPFTFTDVANQKNLINNGKISSVSQSASSTTLIIDVTANSPQLINNYSLTSTCNIIVTNSLGTPQTINIDGQGYSIYFPTIGSSFFQIASNAIVTLTNTVISPYSATGFTFGSGGTIKFGDGSLILLGQDLLLDSNATPLTFVGNATLDGSGQKIRITAASKITINNGKNLTIKNAHIEVANVGAIASLTNSSKITFSNCTLYVESGGFTWSTGHIDIQGETTIFGSNEVTPGASTSFLFNSGGKLTILQNSKLTLGSKINFNYQANPTTNSDTYIQSKRHFLMQTPSATLALCGCTLTSSNTAIAFDYGNLLVDNKTYLVSSTATGAEVELGSALQVYLTPGAVLEVDGPVKYTSTSYP